MSQRSKSPVRAYPTRMLGAEQREQKNGITLVPGRIIRCNLPSPNSRPANPRPIPSSSPTPALTKEPPSNQPLPTNPSVFSVPRLVPPSFLIPPPLFTPPGSSCRAYAKPSLPSYKAVWWIQKVSSPTITHGSTPPPSVQILDAQDRSMHRRR